MIDDQTCRYYSYNFIRVPTSNSIIIKKNFKYLIGIQNFESLREYWR